MANEFIARNGLIAQENSIITGSLTVTGGVVGNLTGTASNATSASYALNATNALTASYFVTSSVTSASYAQNATNASTASFVTPLVQNILLTGSLTSTATIQANKFVFTNGVVNENNLGQRMFATDSNILYIYSGNSGINFNNQGNTQTIASLTNTGNFTAIGGFTGSLQGNANTATSASFATNAATATSATTATTATSASYSATSSYADNFTVRNTLTAQTLVVTTVSSSVVYSSGSNVFGNNLSNTQDFTGSVRITGSLTTNGPANITGSVKVFGDITFNDNTNQNIYFNSVGNRISYSSNNISVINSVGSILLYAAGGGKNVEVVRGDLQIGGGFYGSYNLSVSGSSIISGSLGVGTTGSAIIGRIDASNDIVAFSTSDARLKKNIKPIENALEIISKIGGYTFDWDENLKDIHGYEGSDVGLIAHEIEPVLPPLVKLRDNGYKAVKYEKMVALLIQSTKEQQKIIEDQQRQIDELKELINIYIKTQ